MISGIPLSPSPKEIPVRGDLERMAPSQRTQASELEEPCCFIRGWQHLPGQCSSRRDSSQPSAQGALMRQPVGGLGAELQLTEHCGRGDVTRVRACVCVRAPARQILSVRVKADFSEL